ncbi:MAG: 3D domain-containing protein [Syntrophomonas sp.]
MGRVARRYLLIMIVMVLGAAFTLTYADRIDRAGADTGDPYTPAPGAFQGLTARELQNKARELEATKAIDREYQQSVSRGAERVLMAEASAYTWTGNRTTSGTFPEVGTAAIDPRVIPLGTRLYVEGYGQAVATDTGDAIIGNKIDLYMSSEDEALRWGRRMVKVKILD